MEVFYKVEGTIWYGDSEAKVQILQARLREKLGISSDIFVEVKESTRKIGIQFSFYKKEEEYGFVGSILCLLQLGMPKDGEIVFIDPFRGEQRYIVSDRWFVSDNHCS